MQNTYQYNDHFSFRLPYCWKFRKCNKPTKKKKETISISTSLKIWVVTIEGLKEDFWGAGTVSLLDLGTGDKRCIHFVKIDLAAHFVMLPQKINKNLYLFQQSCSVDGLERLEVISIIYRKKRCLVSPFGIAIPHSLNWLQLPEIWSTEVVTELLLVLPSFQEDTF